jgi:hypothetical protein
MKEGTKLNPGDVVQLGPNTANKAFAFCFMTVSEPKGFGAQGYVQALGTREEFGGQAYYRAKWEDMELVGKAIWATGLDGEGE